MVIQSKRKNIWYYFWRFLSLAILNLWLAVILENWPIIIHKSSNIFDKSYIHALAKGYTGTHADFIIKTLINEAAMYLILILIFVAIVLGIVGFLKDTIIIIKRTRNLINKSWLS